MFYNFIKFFGNLRTAMPAKQKNVRSPKIEFISVFSGKPKARVIKYIGEPDSKEIAIKPKGAQGVVGSKSTC